MKSAAKAFIIVGIVFQFFLIYPLILGIFALNKLESAKHASELTGWGIVTTLLVSLLGGIFMLSIKEENLANELPNATPAMPQLYTPAFEPQPVVQSQPSPSNLFVLAELIDEL